MRDSLKHVLFWVCVTPIIIWGVRAGTAPAATHQWKQGSITHYGVGDGYMGGRTACGKTVRPNSKFAAALTRDLAHCHLKVTIRYRGKNYYTTIEDTGSFGNGGRVLDAAPGLRRVMGFSGVAQIRYKKGWN